MAEEKSNHFGLLLVAIVGIVAIVGLVILFSGNGESNEKGTSAAASVSDSSAGNIGGQAFRTPVSCKDICDEYGGGKCNNILNSCNCICDDSDLYK